MARNSDIRLDVRIFTNRKTKRTIRTLGHEGFVSLLRLWIYAAEHFPRGVIPADIDDGELDEIGMWDPDARSNAGSMRQALQALGWVDSDGVTLHDWQEHQGYAYHAPERSEKSRNAAKVRWGKGVKKGAGGNARSNAGGNAKKKSGNAPSPAPPPTPSPLEGGGVGSDELTVNGSSSPPGYTPATPPPETPCATDGCKGNADGSPSGLCWGCTQTATHRAGPGTADPEEK